MITLPIFSNYENVNLDMKSKEKLTPGFSNDFSYMGLSKQTIDEFNKIFMDYIAYFRFLNNYRMEFDVLLNGLLLGADISKYFKEYMEKFKNFIDIKKQMELIYNARLNNNYHIELLTPKGLLFLQMKGYAQIFQQDINSFSDINNINGFKAFDNMTHKVYEHYTKYHTGNGVDQWKLFSLNTKYIEEHFETLFNSLYQDISAFQDPRDARKITNQQTKHIWREVLPPCDEDDDKDGIKILKKTFGFKSNVYYRDITTIFLKIMPYIFNYLNDIRPLIIPFPQLGNYYGPQIKEFEEFITNHTRYMMEMIHKMFPFYITKSDSDSVYNNLLKTKNLPQSYLGYFKKFKKWFEDVGDTVEEKIKIIENNKKNAKLMEEFNKIIKKRDKMLKNMETYQKKNEFDNYKNERKKLKDIIKDLEKLNINESINAINDIKTTLSNTKQIKKELKMKKFILDIREYYSIKENIRYLNIAFDENNYFSIKAYKDNIKRDLEVFEENINNFEGDIEELKKLDLYKETIEKANEAIKKELPGGKSLEAMQIEQTKIPVIQAYLSSIDIYANIAPNPMMIPAAMMLKTNLVIEINKIRAYINESEEIKKHVESADNKLKILDEFVAKCSAPPK